MEEHLPREFDATATADDVLADVRLDGLQLKSVTQMAAATVWAAVLADAVDDVPGIRGGVMSFALDPERAELLWARSEELVGERC